MVMMVTMVMMMIMRRRWKKISNLVKMTRVMILIIVKGFIMTIHKLELEVTSWQNFTGYEMVQLFGDFEMVCNCADQGLQALGGKFAD